MRPSGRLRHLSRPVTFGPPMSSIVSSLRPAVTRRGFNPLLAISLAASVFALVWVLFWAPKTNFGPAIKDPTDFSKTVLDSLTYAGLLFVVASGFTLIFGLMRAVNMAHGAFFLLGGFIAYKLQQSFTPGIGGGFALSSSQVGAWQWVLPAILGAACIAVVGLVTQQAFLRWNQGQDLRQAMITIAISVILGDQMLAHFNAGNEQSITWPNFIGTDKFLTFGTWSYSWSRLFMLGCAVVIGVALWAWLQRTRTGMVIRA